MENGLMVFTAQFHRRRGFCCGNGCRHCPYEKADPCSQSTPEHPMPVTKIHPMEAGPLNP
jgi:hypothetical protein